MQIPEGCGHVRSVVPSTRGGADGLLYVATTRNSILHGSLQDKLTTVVYVSTDFNNVHHIHSRVKGKRKKVTT